MRFDDLGTVHLIQRLPHTEAQWPKMFNCAPCMLSPLYDGVWIGWWSPHQRIVIGEFSSEIELVHGIRAIDVSSQYDLTWFEAETAQTNAVQKAILADAGLGEIVRTLLGPHRVALLNTGARIGVTSLSPETHAVRARLRQIIENVADDSFTYPD